MSFDVLFYREGPTQTGIFLGSFLGQLFQLSEMSTFLKTISGIGQLIIEFIAQRPSQLRLEDWCQG